MADNLDLDVSGIIDDTETLDARRRSAVRRKCWRSPRASRPRPSGSVTASSRFTGATRRSDLSAECRADGPRAGLSIRAGRTRVAACTAARTAIARRYYPLDHLRAAVFRRHDQLHRSAGDRHPEADAAEGVRLERDRLRATSSSRSSSPTRSACCSPGGSMDRIGARRRLCASRSSCGASRRWRTPRRPRSARRSAALLGVVGLTYSRVGGRVHRRALRARPRRGRQLSRPRSRSSPSGSRSASARSRPASSTRAPTSARWSRRSSCRGSRSTYGLVLGVHRDRRDRVPVAVAVVPLYRHARDASAGQRRRSWRYIRSDPPEPAVHVPWRTILPHRQTWAFALGKFLTDPVWWLYLFWIPDFLNRNHGLDLRAVGPPLVVIYLDRRRRQHRRRLAVVGADQARLDRERARARPRC